jgi:hypothetical protein
MKATCVVCGKADGEIWEGSFTPETGEGEVILKCRLCPSCDTSDFRLALLTILMKATFAAKKSGLK